MDAAQVKRQALQLFILTIGNALQTAYFKQRFGANWQAKNLKDLGWYFFDDGHVVYKAKTTSVTNFVAEDITFLNALGTAGFVMVGEIPEDGILTSYFSRPNEAKVQNV